MFKRINFKMVASVLLLIILIACGNGNESTKRITDKDSLMSTVDFLFKMKSLDQPKDESSIKFIRDMSVYLEDENDKQAFNKIAGLLDQEDFAAAKVIYEELGGTLSSDVAQSLDSVKASPSPIVSVEPSPTLTPVSNPEQIVLKGSGNQATDPFSLKPGFAVFEIEHTGKGNVVFDMLLPSGGTDLLAANRNNYKGRVYEKIVSEGEYTINVSAEGSWTIKITQNYPDTPLTAPVTISGKGDSVYFIEMSKGTTRFSLENKGEKMFIAEIDGRLLGVENGNYSGSKAMQIKDDGIYPLTIKSDGQWNIDIK